MYFNEEFKYMLFDIPVIQENQERVLRVCNGGILRFKTSKGLTNHNPKPNNLTWYFTEYNIFGLCACSQEFYDIYSDLIRGMRAYFQEFQIPMQKQLWLQSWVNSHKPHEVLKSHNHDWPWHGYISIDPKDSETVFTDKPNGTELYRIKNKIGQVYFGPGHRFHHVVVNSPFQGERVTLGFDLENRERILDNRGFFPIVL
jgi:hypothetical protein